MATLIACKEDATNRRISEPQLTPSTHNSWRLSRRLDASAATKWAIDAIVLDDLGGIFLAAPAWETTGATTANASAQSLLNIVHFTSAGKLLWRRKLPLPARSQGQWKICLAHDRRGGLYVALPTTWTTRSAPNTGGSQVLKLSAHDGHDLGRFTLPDTLIQAMALATAPDGNQTLLSFGGRITSESTAARTGGSFLLMVTDGSGQPRWRRTFGIDPSNQRGGIPLPPLVDNGQIYDVTGTDSQISTIGRTAFGISLDSRTVADGSFQNPLFIASFSKATGEFIWSRTLGDASGPAARLFASESEVLVIAAIRSMETGRLLQTISAIKFDHDGRELSRAAIANTETAFPVLAAHHRQRILVGYRPTTRNMFEVLTLDTPSMQVLHRDQAAEMLIGIATTDHMTVTISCDGSDASGCDPMVEISDNSPAGVQK